MATLRIGDEASFSAFAQGCGCTLAKVKLALETVGYDEEDIIRWLQKRHWISDEQFQRLSNSLGAEQLFAGTVQSALMPNQSPTAIKSHNTRSHWKAKMVVPDIAAADTQQAFEKFLRIKMVRSTAMQQSYTQSQADAVSEIVATRRLVIALVDAQEHLQDDRRDG